MRGGVVATRRAHNPEVAGSSPAPATKRKGGRRRKMGNAEIALAMELMNDGMSRKLIAYGLGVHQSTMYHAVRKAKREGMIR